MISTAVESAKLSSLGSATSALARTLDLNWSLDVDKMGTQLVMRVAPKESLAFDAANLLLGGVEYAMGNARSFHERTIKLKQRCAAFLLVNPIGIPSSTDTCHLETTSASSILIHLAL